MAELVEGAPLLREYGVKNSIEGSNPSLSAIISINGPGTTSSIRFCEKTRWCFDQPLLDNKDVGPQNRRLYMRP